MRPEERIYRTLMNSKYGAVINLALKQTAQYGPDSKYAQDLLLAHLGQLLMKIMEKGIDQIKGGDFEPRRSSRRTRRGGS